MANSPETTTHTSMIWIEAGRFRMGSEDFYPEERPVHTVEVSGFWIDPTTVTNAQYAQFVAETGYVTVAERPLNPADYPGVPLENLVPGAMVFYPTAGPVNLSDYSNWWCWVPGAAWNHPLGPQSTVDDLADHPVVHIAYEDAEAYATWAGKTLPSEAEWEFAARGGLDGAPFVWGHEHIPDGRPMANTWQGEFPWQNLLQDGYPRTAPVGSFPANGYGLYDMAGNVWEWTSDWYIARRAEATAKACCGPPVNPRTTSATQSYDPMQPHIRIPRKVLKGGSHLCAPNYCLRYRPAARQPQMIDTGMSHLGFRCIVRPGETP